MSCSHLYNSPHAQRTQLNQVFTKAILMRDLLCSLVTLHCHWMSLAS